ncbi:MAG: rod shape-determining protein MreD [Gammaproteobacteria bacterium]|nr:rod shape-determining protein MreD [Pseudomonadota bacterium]MCH8976941.1 rod shape-determining protein MreD [Pseudomonadota bacterium]TDJ17566.1 MAG: rod shape-determining protein MreD [Gammaproteobacteria bacterium]
MLNKNTGGWILFISLLIAFLLTALPLPHWADDWRPAWVAMVLIYWCMALPERIGIGIAWCMGLLLDVQQGALLGQNALGLALIAYFVIQIHKRFRLFPLVQQSCLVGFIIIFYLLISSWVTGIMGIPPKTWTYWMPAISSMVLWPWLFVILRDIRRQYNVT